MKNFFLLTAIILLTQSCFGQAGPGAIFQGSNILLLKPNLKFKDSNVLILTNDTDNPTVVAKNAPQGSLYIRSGTGVLYQKTDNGLSLNWQPLLVGPAGTGTDECVARWDGTGSPTLQNSVFCITDAGIATGLTQLNLENLRLDLNTVSSTAGNLVLDAFDGNVNLPDLTASLPVQTDASKNLVSAAINLSGSQVTSVLPIANGGTNSSTALNNSRVMVSVGGAIVENAALVVSSPVRSDASGFLTTGDLNAATELTGLVPLANAGLGVDASAFADFTMIYKNGAAYSAIGPLTNGQLIIGSTGVAPVASALTGTANQVVVTNGAGSITLSTPQDIAATSNVTFGSVTDSSLTAGRNTFAGVAGDLSDDGDWLFNTVGNIVTLTNGQMNVDNLRLDGNTLSSEDVNGNIILNPNGTGQVNLPDLTASTPLKLDASNNVITADIVLTTDVTGVLPEANGGTNQSTYATGDILYASAPNTLSKLPAGANGDYLQLTAGVPDWVTVAASGVQTIGVIDSQAKSANGAVITGTSLVYQTADASFPGLVSTGAQTFAGDKTLSGTTNLSALTASLPLQLDASKNIISTAIDLATAQVTGILTMNKGGTNKNMTASNGSLIYSDADSFEFSGVCTSGQVWISGGAGAPTCYAPTATRVLYAGTGGILADDAGMTYVAANDELTVGTIVNNSTTRAAQECPQQTTAQRTTTGGTLGTGDKGKCVTDTDINKEYRWNGTAWEQVATASPGQYWAGSLSGADVDLGTSADAGTWNNAANASLTTFASEISPTGNISCAVIGSGNVGVTCTGLTTGLKKVCFGGLRTMVGTNIDQSFRVASCDGTSVCSTTTADDYSETWSDTSTLATNRSGPNYTCRTVDVLASGDYTFNLQETTDAVTAATTNNILASSVQRKIYISVEDASGSGGGGSTTYSAKLSTAQAVSNETGDWISGNCTNANPSVCTFVSGVFGGTTPNCWAAPGASNFVKYKITTSTTVMTVENDAGVNVDYLVFCTKGP